MRRKRGAAPPRARRTNATPSVDLKVTTIPADAEQLKAMSDAIVWLALTHVRARQLAAAAGHAPRPDQRKSPDSSEKRGG